MISLFCKQLHSILIDSLCMIFRRTCLCFSFFTSKIDALLESLLKQPFLCCYAVRLSRNQLIFLPCTSVFKAVLVPYQSILLLFHLRGVWNLRLSKLVGVQLSFWHQLPCGSDTMVGFEIIPALTEPSRDTSIHSIFQNFQKLGW